MKHLALLLLFALTAAAQFPPGSSAAKRIRGTGDTLPAACAVGDLWLRTGATTPGVCGCTAADTWVCPGAGSGDVVGPATNTDNHIPQWNGANSKTLKDGLAVAATATASTVAQRNASGEVIAVNTVATGKTPLATDGSAASLTSFPTLNQNTTGTAAALAAQYIDWNAASGGTSIANKPTLTNGDVVGTSGAGVPSANCTAGKAIYLDTTNSQWYACTATNTWSLVLTTSGTGTGVWTLREGTAPGAPSAAADHALYIDDADSLLKTHENGGSVVVYHSTANPQTITRAFGYSFGDPAGSALTARVSNAFRVPYSCTITDWSVSVDAGTATASIWRAATGTAIPTIAGTLNTSGVAISSGTHVLSTTLTDFTSTAIAANDVIRVSLDAVSTAKFVTIQIGCNQ